MSTFSIESVEPLTYDFTGATSNSGEGKCKGKGTVPEPSQPRLEAYSAAVRELFNVKENKDVAAAIDQQAEAKEKSSTLLALTAELCQNSPSKEEMEELPPRIQKAWLKHLYKELADPEVSSAATRR